MTGSTIFALVFLSVICFGLALGAYLAEKAEKHGIDPHLGKTRVGIDRKRR
jgi:hypothetical protein